MRIQFLQQEEEMRNGRGDEQHGAAAVGETKGAAGTLVEELMVRVEATGIAWNGGRHTDRRCQDPVRMGPYCSRERLGVYVRV